jgi:phytanoyl-CoA hydroxylase
MSKPFFAYQAQEIKSYYEEYGYVVVRDIISNEQITSFCDSYAALKTAKNYYFLSQDTNRPEKLAINEQGFIEHSILNPIDLPFQRKFSSATFNIIAAEAISLLLEILSGNEKHVVWQTMFFDKSTGTVAHQDHYYLDSNPPGNLVACWFALETIHRDAGPFFVVPKSHRGPLIAKNTNISEFSDHEDYVTKIQNLVQKQNYSPQPMLLEKGSVLFWHPFLIHGAFPNIHPQYSRKSFTAHYLPEGYGRFGKSLPSSVQSSNPNILVWEKTLSDRVKASVRQIRFQLMYKLRPKNKASKMEMRSSKYQNS